MSYGCLFLVRMDAVRSAFELFLCRVRSLLSLFLAPPKCGETLKNPTGRDKSSTNISTCLVGTPAIRIITRIICTAPCKHVGSDALRVARPLHCQRQVTTAHVRVPFGTGAPVQCSMSFFQATSGHFQVSLHPF